MGNTRSSLADEDEEALSTPEGLLQGLPVRNAEHFSTCKAGGYHRFQVAEAATYIATHDRTLPPPDQVVRTEKTQILLRRFMQMAEAQRRAPKRPVPEPSPTPEPKEAPADKVARVGD